MYMKTIRDYLGKTFCFLILLLGIMWFYGGVTEALSANEEVVVYTSLDQVFSQPILKDFEKKTGVKVRAVYDVEASKTTGLVNRLIAEKSYPRADVFWNSEVGKTLVLKNKGILSPYHSPSAKDIPAQFKDPEGYWTGFGARCRVLIYNTKLLGPSELPESIFELIQPRWRKKVTMGYPLFGTTATHVAALYAVLGKEKAEAYLKALRDNQVLIVNGNAMVRDVVVRGEVPIGFTDTDDVNVAIEAGKPVKMIFPDREGIGTLFIPNTVCMIKNGPNPEAGKKLVDYLLSMEVEERLAFSPSAQIPVRNAVKSPPHVPRPSEIKAMRVDYDEIAKEMKPSARFCLELFRR